MASVILVRGGVRMIDKEMTIPEAKKVIYDLCYTNDTYDDDQIANMIDCLCNELEQTQKELEEVESKLSELLCYVTGGRLSKINYDINYMKEVADDYQRDMCVNGCDELEALMSKLEYVERERDTAIKDLTGDCVACKHLSYCSLHPCYCVNGNVWEWRGVPNKNKPNT